MSGASQPLPETFRAACAQFDVARGDVQRNERRAETVLRDAHSAGCRLAVLPEMWTTSFLDDYSDDILERSGLAEARLAEVSEELDMLVVGSAPARDADTPEGRVVNRAVVVDRGLSLGHYDKIHLFSPNMEHRHHAAGDHPLVLDTRFGRIGVALCYDLRFPELIRHYFVEGCDLLLVPAQWPEARADHWRSLVKARAIENQMFVIGCNRTGGEESMKRAGETLQFPGDSRVVDPMGTVLAAGAGEQAAVDAEIELRRVRAMRRILPVAKDRRPEVYYRLWGPADEAPEED